MIAGHYIKLHHILLFIFTGYYKGDKEPTKCHPCPLGYYTDKFLTIRCDRCPEDFYCPVSRLHIYNIHFVLNVDKTESAFQYVAIKL